MTTIRQYIQTSPAKAKELLAKLVETSDNAVKTRERLLSELKKELELFNQLEEQYLFPVLQKHKGTKTLVAEAINDNEETRKLLAELEGMPADSEEFGSKVSDLRKAFQRHVRDEKNELLPAILKALSDEEAESIISSIEGQKAEMEAARRREADERRMHAQREREQAEAIEETAQNLTSSVKAGAENVEKIARTAQGTVQNGLGAAFDVARSSAGGLMAMFGLAGPRADRAQVGTEQAGKNIQAVVQTSTVLMRGIQDVSRECLEMSRDRLQRNLSGFTVLGRCRSIHDLIAVQTSFIRGNLELTIENSRRLAELAVDVAQEATQTMYAEETDLGVSVTQRAA